MKPLLYKISGVWANHEGLDAALGRHLGVYGAMVPLSASASSGAQRALACKVARRGGLSAFCYVQTRLSGSTLFR